MTTKLEHHIAAAIGQLEMLEQDVAHRVQDVRFDATYDLRTFGRIYREYESVERTTRQLRTVQAAVTRLASLGERA